MAEMDGSLIDKKVDKGIYPERLDQFGTIVLLTCLSLGGVSKHLKLTTKPNCFESSTER